MHSGQLNVTRAIVADFVCCPQRSSRFVSPSGLDRRRRSLLLVKSSARLVQIGTPSSILFFLSKSEKQILVSEKKTLKKCIIY